MSAPPIAVPEKIIGLTLPLDFFDRCYSLSSLHLPQAALASLPPVPISLVTFLFGDKKVTVSSLARHEKTTPIPKK